MIEQRKLQYQVYKQIRSMMLNLAQNSPPEIKIPTTIVVEKKQNIYLVPGMYIFLKQKK